MYEQLRFEIRDGLIEIVNRYPSNMGAPGQTREKKRRKTPEEMAKQNQRNREKTVQRLIQANFREGDFHLILKYRNKPVSFEAAKEDLRRFLSTMRRIYRKAGYIFKYIGVTERGKRAATLHHHLIIENIQSKDLNTVKTVQEIWKGHCAFNDLYEDGDYADLAAYIVKKESKEENKGCSYTRSRNLAVPKARKVVYRRKIWSQEPKAKKGWYVVKNSVVDSINVFTGMPYQTYMTKQIKTEKELTAERADRERSASRIKPCSKSMSTLRRQAESKPKKDAMDSSRNTSRRMVIRLRGRDSRRKRIQHHRR